MLLDEHEYILLVEGGEVLLDGSPTAVVEGVDSERKADSSSSCFETEVDNEPEAARCADGRLDDHAWAQRLDSTIES